jgi:hypothetical protein
MTSPWKDDRQLASRFHPDYPDDVQVFVHDGGPRLSACRPELVWVRIIAATNGVYSATVLNQPLHLKTVKQDDVIRFIVTDSCKYPILVTTRYLQEREAWTIHPCDKCGFSELFDAPSDLIRIVFSNIKEGYKLEMFSAFCPLCGGAQVAEKKAFAMKKKSSQRKWWQFWKS